MNGRNKKARKTRYTTTQDIVIGINTISHNLNLSDPKGFLSQIIIGDKEPRTIDNFTNFLTNAFSWESKVAITGAYFIIIS